MSSPGNQWWEGECEEGGSDAGENADEVAVLREGTKPCQPNEILSGQAVVLTCAEEKLN